MNVPGHFKRRYMCTCTCIVQGLEVVAFLWTTQIFLYFYPVQELNNVTLDRD